MNIPTVVPHVLTVEAEQNDGPSCVSLVRNPVFGTGGINILTGARVGTAGIQMILAHSASGLIIDEKSGIGNTNEGLCVR